MLDPRVRGSRRLPARLKMKAWESRQCGPERAVCEVMRVKLKVQRDPRKVEKPRTWSV